jgi:hypothetical protein
MKTALHLPRLLAMLALANAIGVGRPASVWAKSELFCAAAILRSVPIDEIPLERRQIGSFLLPNEFRFDVFRAEIAEAGGDILGTGTIRMDQAAAHASEGYSVYSLDYDPAVKLLNESHQALGLESGDRLAYFYRLFRIPEALRNPDHRRELDESPSEFLGWLNANGRPLDAWDRLSPTLLYERNPGGAPQAVVTGYIEHSLKLFATLARFAAIPEAWTQSIWGSEARFQDWRRKIRAGELVSHTASWSGDSFGALETLSGKLRAHGRKVAIVDLSNIMVFQLASERDARNLRDRLAGLPWAPNARILFTANRTFSSATPRRHDHWIYFSVPAAWLVDQIGNGALRGRAAYIQFLRDLYLGPATLISHEGKKASLFLP